MDRVVGVMKAYDAHWRGAVADGRCGFCQTTARNGARIWGDGTCPPLRLFDAVATHYATMINGIDELAITNLDGLDGVNPISICVGYRLNGKRLDVPPCDSAQWNNCEPIYESMPGWPEPTRSARKFSDLPKRARDYLKRISALTGAKLTIVSVGPTRAETIML